MSAPLAEIVRIYLDWLDESRKQPGELSTERELANAETQMRELSGWNGSRGPLFGPHVEPSPGMDRYDRELSKRQHVPFRIVDTCVKCHTENTVDLARGDHHLYAARLGEQTNVYFICSRCEHDWAVRITPHIIITIEQKGI